MTEHDGDKLTLEKAEGAVWPDPPADATRVMKSVYALRKKPIRALSPEDLRVLLTQRVGVDLIIPRALELLEQNPLLAGDFYPGDVLCAALRVDKNFWLAHDDATARLRTVIQNFEQLEDLDIYFPEDDDIWESISGLREADILT